MSNHEPEAGRPPGEPDASRERVLRRSKRDRIIGGVAGGLGRYLGIDPVIIRIAFVALTLAGASGILLYLVLWLVVPEESRDERTAPRPAPRDSTHTVPLVIGVVLIAIGGILLVERVIPDLSRLMWPLVLVAIGVLVIVQGARR